jgi:prefoldin alpha subunit
MSSGNDAKEVKEAGRIQLEEILVRFNELREYANILASTINTYLTQQRELQLALETLKNLPEDGGEGYIILDRLSSAMIPAVINKEWSKGILVHLGLGYYLKADKAKALEIISKRSSNIERVLGELQKRYSVVLEELNRLQQLLSRGYSGSQSKGGG